MLPNVMAPSGPGDPCPTRGTVPEGGEPGEPGVGLLSTRPSSLCRTWCRAALSVRSRFSLAARSLVMLSFRSSGSSKECMVRGLGLEVAASRGELPSWCSGRNLGEDRSRAVTQWPQAPSQAHGGGRQSV